MAQRTEAMDQNAEINADVVQHCILFPTYATHHSRSGSMDPRDWNIRVRGWAFTKRSNRRKRLVMGMARKLAGVTKDNDVYGTLESRFGMFLANNTQGARFTIQCVGPTKTDKMNIAADELHDESTEALMDDSKAPDAKLAIDHVAEDKEELRKNLKGRRGYLYAEAELNSHDYPEKTVEMAAEKFKNGRHSQEQYERQPERQPMPPPQTNEGHVPTFADRLSKGTAMMKSAYQKYTNNGDTLNSASSNAQPRSRPDSVASNRTSSSSASSIANTEPPPITYYDNLGSGKLPTVNLYSKPGGHFDGTLRITHNDVQAHQVQNKIIGGQQRGGHPRFLKLHASHSDMPTVTDGIVNLIDSKGVSVISDIDDTIKDTKVLDGAKMVLRNTFLREMRGVPGMAQVYYKWWEAGVAFHYVSNSPWQLISSLLDFFHNHKFPPGSAHLRLIDSVLKTYFMAPGEHKRTTVANILEDFEERQFILIGDSGEIDMEIYTDLAKTFPNQIFKIFIRDITTKRLKDEQTKAEALARSRAMSPNQRPSVLSYVEGFFSQHTKTVDYSSPKGSPGTPGSRSHPNPSIQSDFPFPGSIANDGSVTSMTRHGISSYSVTSSRELGDTTSNQGLSPSLNSSVTRMSMASSSTESFSNSSTTTVSSTNVAVAAAMTDPEDELMPGGVPPQIPVQIKSPLELWYERIEQCREKLGTARDKLVLFEDSSVLQDCLEVQEMIQLYKTAEDEENRGKEEATRAGTVEVPVGNLIDLHV
ncbi:hypothetical protein BGZ76_009512 [Entomortierella beljakovae]|nr:hypothetical protein BGZ76_009512 [Entomortierella beljakovae]